MSIFTSFFPGALDQKPPESSFAPADEDSRPSPLSNTMKILYWARSDLTSGNSVTFRH